MGLTASDGAENRGIRRSETVGEALTSIREQLSADDGFTQLCLDPVLGGGADLEAASAWCESQYPRVMFFASSEAASQLDAATAAGASFAANRRYTAGVWSRRADGKALALAGYFSSIDFATSGSLKTGNLAILAGTSPDRLSALEEAALVSRNWNYTGYEGRLRDGRLSNGEWIDVRLWALWFENALQSEIYDVIKQGRTPLTDAGVRSIREAIVSVCEEGVRNGGIAPTATAPLEMKRDIATTTSTPAFDGTLPRGFLVWVDSVATLSSDARTRRRTPPFRVWAVGGGFVHGASITVSFQP